MIRLNEVVRVGPDPEGLGFFSEEEIRTQTHRGTTCEDTEGRRPSTLQGQACVSGREQPSPPAAQVWGQVGAAWSGKLCSSGAWRCWARPGPTALTEM